MRTGDDVVSGTCPHRLGFPRREINSVRRLARNRLAVQASGRAPSPPRLQPPSVLPHRGREPWRSRDAADPRRERPERPDRGGSRRSADRGRGALHGGRARGHVRARGGRCPPARTRLRASLPRPGGARARPRRNPRRRRLGRLGVRCRGPGVRRPVRADRGHLHRPECRGDAQAGRQDRLQADRRGRRRTRRPVEPGRCRNAGRGAGRGGQGGLPADAQGDRRRRWPRHQDGRRPGRPRGRLPAHPRRGATRLRKRRRLPREAGHGRPARRGAGDRRQSRARLGAGRPGLLGAATEPEGHRGVRISPARQQPDRRAEGVGRAPRPGGRLRGGCDRRVPLPPRREDVRVPRGQHPAAGGAPDHRGDHGRRPGQGADQGRGGRQPRGQQARGDRSRCRGTAQRRGPGPRLRALPWPDRAPGAAVWAGHPGRHRCGRGRQHPGRLRLHDREDHRGRQHPRGGTRATTSRHVGDDRGDRGRCHEQELHPRPARPARGRRRPGRGLGRHGLDRPGPRRGQAALPPVLGDRPRGRGHPRLRGRGAARDRPPARDRARWPAERTARGRPRRRPQAARHVVQGHRAARGTVALPGHDRRGRRRARRRGGGRAARRVPQHPGRRRPPVPSGDRHARTRPAGRGRRGHPSRHARRGRHAPLTRARARRRHPRRGG